METKEILFGKLIVHCSYPTYEEWKRLLSENTSSKIKGSYPTYEEWKLKCDLDTFLTMYVLILPMRNGNLNNRSNSSSEGNVLILPMRNGNFSL